MEKYHHFPRDGVWSSELLKKINEARNIAVLTLGAVTGGSLQNALSTIQANRQDRRVGYGLLRALIIHARPAGDPEWRTLYNSFAYRIDYAWRSFLPNRSVLNDELDTLRTINRDDLDGEEAEFWERRQSFCAGEKGQGETPLFWGAEPRTLLSPNSIFGDRLDPVTTFVPVGAAMEARRHEKCRAPERMVFDLAGMTRSYYDPLILASMFRWLFSYEAWWGLGAGASGRVIDELLCRAQPDQRRILVPEILLASAQGKVPESGMQSAKAYSERVMRDTPAVSGTLKLALRLADHHLSLAKQATPQHPPP